MSFREKYIIKSIVVPLVTVFIGQMYFFLQTSGLSTGY